MADELKTFLVLFKDGHKITLRAHHYDSKSHIFMKSAQDADPDIWVRSGEILAVVPVEKEEPYGGSSSFSG